jgi:hypothetical protein
MVFGGIVTSPRSSLSTQQALELARVYLENACRAKDADIILVLCHDTEVSLSQAKRLAKHSDNQLERKRIGTVYIQLGKVLHNQGHSKEAQISYKKAEKLGYVQGFGSFIYYTGLERIGKEILIVIYLINHTTLQSKCSGS